jgi:hypothetical protein
MLINLVWLHCKLVKVFLPMIAIYEVEACYRMYSHFIQ